MKSKFHFFKDIGNRQQETETGRNRINRHWALAYCAMRANPCSLDCSRGGGEVGGCVGWGVSVLHTRCCPQAVSALLCAVCRFWCPEKASGNQSPQPTRCACDGSVQVLHPYMAHPFQSDLVHALVHSMLCCCYVHIIIQYFDVVRLVHACNVMLNNIHSRVW